MSRLISIIRKAPKHVTALIAIIAAALIVPAGLLAWGPSRPTYTMAHPADHITFNSITDEPNVGDERNFVGARDANSANVWFDNINVQEGHEYLVRAFVHNDAAANLNLVAQNVTAKFNVPTTTGKSVTVAGFIDSSNASPTEVWDETTFTSSQDFNLAYVPGSALFENNFFGPSGVKLSDSIVTNSGVLLGYNKLDGRIPGCEQFSGYVSFKVRPQFSPTNQFTMNKRVRLHGTTQFSKEVTAKPGDTVDFVIDYDNVGQTRQNAVTIRDTLPAGLTYVNGSTVLTNANHPNGIGIGDNIATTTGENIGDYMPNSNAFAIFSARVAANDNLPQCGMNTLVDNARVTTMGGSLSSSANVVVNRVCVTPTPTPTPPTLPTTGPIESVSAALGIGSLVTAGGYYVTSRKRA